MQQPRRASGYALCRVPRLRAGCALEVIPECAYRSHDPQRAGVSGLRRAEWVYLKGHAAEAVQDGAGQDYARLGAALHGADGAGYADHDEPNPG